MLGHLKPSLCQLSEESKKTYWQFYCSGCQSLRKQNNILYSFLLNHELTLLLYAFQDELNGAKANQTNCPASAFILKKTTFSHAAIDKSEQLSIVLAWIKAIDWHTDKPNVFNNSLSKILSKKAKKIIQSLKPSSQTIIQDYIHLTKTNEQDFGRVRYQSCLLSQMLVDEIADCMEIAPSIVLQIKEVFGKAGELIAIADHLIDLDKDIQGKQYNPIIDFAEKRNSSLAEEYMILKKEYNSLRYEIESLLPTFHTLFVEALRSSLRQLDAKIHQYLPLCMRSEDAKLLAGRLQITHGGLSPLLPPGTNSDCWDSCANECCATCTVACVQFSCGCCCEATKNGCNSTREERQMRREERRRQKEERKQQRNQDSNG